MTATLTSAPPPPAPPRRSHARRWLAAGAVLALLAAAVWVVGFSPLLGVRTVAVRGAATVSDQQVRDAARIPAGTPLVRLSTSAVRDRVRTLAPVADARVSVSYPSTVVITVVERRPVGYLRDGGRTVLVDSAGVRFRTVDAPPSGMPRLDLGTGDPRAAGSALSTVAGALTDDERSAVSVIKASGTAVTLTLGDGRTVLWGTAERNADKARVLTALLRQPGRTIDLSDPDVVVVH